MRRLTVASTIIALACPAEALNLGSGTATGTAGIAVSDPAGQPAAAVGASAIAIGTDT